MAGVRRYQDLICWQLADKLADLADAMTSTEPCASDPDIKGQIRRAAGKAPAQIAEAFLRYRPADTANLLRIARASLGEFQNHLHRGAKRKYWKQEEVDTARQLSDRAIGATTNFMKDRLKAAERQKRRPRPERDEST